MCPRADPAAPLRMWCLPFAGGGAAAWHPWAQPLAGLAEVVAFRPPGRENRVSEPAFVRLHDIIPPLVDQIAPFANEDYALCGHSLGGLVAFELARALRARGLGLPRALVVCGVRAPHFPADEPWLHPLPRARFIAEVEQRYGAIPPEIRDCPDVMDLLLPVLRADLEIYETYRYAPGQPLPVPLLALGGELDRNVPRPALLAWSGYTTERFKSGWIRRGGHFFPQEQLADTLPPVRAFLEQCVRAGAANSTASTSAPSRPRPTAAA